MLIVWVFLPRYLMWTVGRHWKIGRKARNCHLWWPWLSSFHFLVQSRIRVVQEKEICNFQNCVAGVTNAVSRPLVLSRLYKEVCFWGLPEYMADLLQWPGLMIMSSPWSLMCRDTFDQENGGEFCLYLDGCSVTARAQNLILLEKRPPKIVICDNDTLFLKP